MLADLPTAYAWVDDIAQRHDLPGCCRVAMQSAVEEAVSNVIRHGYPAARPAAGDRIRLTCHVLDDAVALTIEDPAVPFDPRTKPSPVRAMASEPTDPGGLGIHLMRRRSISMHYEWRDGLNRLTLHLNRSGLA